MNFREPPAVSVVLMSRRPSAPYVDALSEDGVHLTYEGHDVARVQGSVVDPKTVDQPWAYPSGAPTENAKFANASELRPPARIRVYEKLRDGIWSDRGLFDLTGYMYARVGGRKVFRFSMQLVIDEPTFDSVPIPPAFNRAIPSYVKQAVYKRDRGKCVICGATTELHFDHDLPYSKGGSGLTEANVRILCVRHNLTKSARIE
jgi:hypothetical protein